MAEPVVSSELHDLYSDHHSWLRSLLRRKLGSLTDAADIAHDAYVRVIVTGRVPQRDQSRRHLAQIANGLVVDLFRRRRVEAAYLDTIAHLPEAQVPSPETAVLVIETLVEIDAALGRLPYKARQAFLLCKLDGLSYREIAARLDVSTSSVEKYIARALMACYAVSFGDSPDAN